MTWALRGTEAEAAGEEEREAECIMGGHPAAGLGELLL